MSTAIGELTLLVGSKKSFDVLLVDDDGSKEDLTNADHATFVIKTDVDASTDILLRRTADANLTIDKPNSKLVCTLTQVEADALVPGVYIGQASIRIDGTSWVKTDRLRVTLLKSFSPNTAT